MKKLTLAEVDDIYAQEPAWIVKSWEAQDTGVDPLGLRQTNLDMMDRVLPGINNVTRHIRVYTVMTWAWWKAGRLLSNEDQHAVSSAEMRDFVDRVDAVFSWSQFMLDADASLPGKTVLPKELAPADAKIAYDFSSERWPKLRTSRRNSTDLLGAVQYGPSVRGAQGLHWLLANDGVFVPNLDVMPAIEAFDARLAPHLPKCLRDPKWTTITHKELTAIGPLWRFDEPAPLESKVFAELFFGDDTQVQKDALLARRRGTLNLMRTALAAIGTPCKAEDLRAAMFQLVLDDNGAALSKSRHAWRVLQIRQLQRLAIEALYTFIEVRLKAAHRMGSADVVAALQEALTERGLSPALTTDEMLEAAFQAGGDSEADWRWPHDADSALFSLIEAIVAAQRVDLEAVPLLAVAALHCAALLTTAEQLDEQGASALRDFEREPDRLPIGLMLSRIQALRHRPADQLLREIVEAWVFGQHVRWSIARSGDGKQRLRVTLDEGGWVFLRGKLSGAFSPTPDRLLSALRLSAGCGLVEAMGDDLWGLP